MEVKYGKVITSGKGGVGRQQLQQYWYWFSVRRKSVVLLDRYWFKVDVVMGLENRNI